MIRVVLLLFWFIHTRSNTIMCAWYVIHICIYIITYCYTLYTFKLSLWPSGQCSTTIPPSRQLDIVSPVAFHTRECKPPIHSSETYNYLTSSPSIVVGHLEFNIQVSFHQPNSSIPIFFLFPPLRQWRLFPKHFFIFCRWKIEQLF